MKYTSKALLLIAGLAVSACTNAGRFDDDLDDFGSDSSAGGADFGAADVTTGGLGDPTSKEYFTQSVGDRVLFEVDQATLTTQGRATLDAQAAWLTTNNDYFATIEGHADEQGTREYNIGLSNRRAVAVRDYLVSKGIPASRLATVGFGKERPIAVCSEESCYSQNRRAVTILTRGATS